MITLPHEVVGEAYIEPKYEDIVPFEFVWYYHQCSSVSMQMVIIFR